MKKIGLLVVALVFILAGPGYASWRVGAFGVMYSPSFGEINDDLDVINLTWGTNLRLRGTLIYGVSLEYSFSSRFAVRGEMSHFSLRTSDTYYDNDQVLHNVTVSIDGLPIFMNGIYKFDSGEDVSPYQEVVTPYIGIGIGRLSTQYKQKEEIFSSLPKVILRSDEDGPAVFQLLAGAEVSFPQNRNFILLAQVKYIWGEAIILGSSLDWEGTSYNIGVQGKF